jgi:hypothetical protein
MELRSSEQRRVRRSQSVLSEGRRSSSKQWGSCSGAHVQGKCFGQNSLTVSLEDELRAYS